MAVEIATTNSYLLTSTPTQVLPYSDSYCYGCCYHYHYHCWRHHYHHRHHHHHHHDDNYYCHCKCTFNLAARQVVEAVVSLHLGFVLRRTRPTAGGAARLAAAVSGFKRCHLVAASSDSAAVRRLAKTLIMMKMMVIMVVVMLVLLMRTIITTRILTMDFLLAVRLSTATPPSECRYDEPSMRYSYLRRLDSTCHK